MCGDYQNKAAGTVLLFTHRGMQLQCTGEKTLRDPGHRNGLQAASGEENVRCGDE